MDNDSRFPSTSPNNNSEWSLFSHGLSICERLGGTVTKTSAQFAKSVVVPRGKQGRSFEAEPGRAGMGEWARMAPTHSDLFTQPFSSATSDLLRAYLDELYHWNDRTNLTRVPKEDAWERHVVEPLSQLAGLPWVGTAADLGSGGGIPGIPMAIANSGLHLKLVESNQRKAGFLMHLVGLLSLPNVEVVAQRAESLGKKDGWQATCDGVVARAAGPAIDVAGWAVPLLAPGGFVVILTHATRAIADDIGQALVAERDLRVRVEPERLIVGPSSLIDALGGTIAPSS